jgi:hypothetical protein
LVSLIRHLKYGELEVDFAEGIRLVESLAESILPEGEDARAKRLETSLAQLAKVNPSAAVIAAWVEVEQALIDAAERILLIRADKPATRDPVNIARALLFEQDRTMLAIFTELRSLRNSAARPDVRVPVSEAIDFVHLASRLAARIAAKV